MNAAGAILVAVAVSLDRQEKSTDAATESAIQVKRSRPVPLQGIMRTAQQNAVPYNTIQYHTIPYYPKAPDIIYPTTILHANAAS